MVKVIETVYNGYRFRSRNEARWAVFFDNLKLKYRYEVEGFDLNGLWYLPDFYLPGQQCWVEVKPDLPTKEEREKAIRLCIGKKETVFILAGDVWKDVLCFCFDTRNSSITSNTKNKLNKYYEKVKRQIQWLSSAECICQDVLGNFCGYDIERGFRWSMAYWSECTNCRALGLLSWLAPAVFVHETNLCKCNIYNCYTDRVVEAFEAARQARF